MGRRQEMWGRQEGGGRRLTAEGSDALAVTQAQETTRQRSGRGGVGGKRGGGQGPPRHGCRLSRGDTQISLCKHSGEVGGVKLHTCLVCVAATRCGRGVGRRGGVPVASSSWVKGVRTRHCAHCVEALRPCGRACLHLHKEGKEKIQRGRNKQSLVCARPTPHPARHAPIP